MLLELAGIQAKVHQCPGNLICPQKYRQQKQKIDKWNCIKLKSFLQRGEQSTEPGSTLSQRESVCKTDLERRQCSKHVRNQLNSKKTNRAI